MNPQNFLCKTTTRWFCLLAIFLLVTGCTKTPQAGQPGGPAPAVVEIWHSLQGAEADALQGQIQTITKAHPEVIIKLKYEPEQSFVAFSYQAEAGGEFGTLAANLSSVASDARRGGPRGSSTYT